MKALVVGTGGVGQSIAAIAKRRDPKGEWLEKMVMADYDGARAADFVATLKDPRFVADRQHLFHAHPTQGHHRHRPWRVGWGLCV